MFLLISDWGSAYDPDPGTELFKVIQGGENNLILVERKESERGERLQESELVVPQSGTRRLIRLHSEVDQFEGNAMGISQKRSAEPISDSGCMANGVWIDVFRLRYEQKRGSCREQDILMKRSKKPRSRCVIAGWVVDKSPGPDGFSFYFYRHFWSMIEDDVFGAVEYFFINGDIPNGSCTISFHGGVDAGNDLMVIICAATSRSFGMFFRAFWSSRINMSKSRLWVGVNVEDAKMDVENSFYWRKFRLSSPVLGSNDNLSFVLFKVRLGRVLLQVVVAVGFYSQKDSLWTKVIKALYGEDGSLDKVGASAARTCWTTIVQEVKVIQAQGINIHDISNKAGNWWRILVFGLINGTRGGVL
ncbi:hypothetical protein Tco_0702452 [Tanacetum coccineum]|uniref:Uncharacterized protein n=1 Tax=Tanacetum coccineum TaxID=301880 RepID=A0ABQ4XWM0_9ASTR